MLDFSLRPRPDFLSGNLQSKVSMYIAFLIYVHIKFTFSISAPLSAIIHQNLFLNRDLTIRALFPFPIEYLYKHCISFFGACLSSSCSFMSYLSFGVFSNPFSLDELLFLSSVFLSELKSLSDLEFSSLSLFCLFLSAFFPCGGVGKMSWLSIYIFLMSLHASFSFS